MNYESFKNQIQKSVREEEVKVIYANYFKLDYDTSERHDLYTPQVLFEFKANKNFANLKGLATVLAQSLYYIRRLKYSETNKAIPFFICLADKDEAVLTEVRKWIPFYSNDAYNWELPASKPDSKLIDHLVKDSETAKLHVYSVTKKTEHEAFRDNMIRALNPQMIFDFGDKKVINEENFEAVYDHWKNVIGKYIINGYKPSFYFLSNLQPEKTIVDTENNKVSFTFEDRNSKTQTVLMKDYQYFWGLYDHVTNADTIKGIHAKLDRLTDESQRRFEGEFYTPLIFGKKAIHYLTEVLGKNWLKSGKYRIWDMAAGTGNLEYHLPSEAWKYLYMSTLLPSDADHLKKVFPGATSFQYDYLNDDVEYLFHKEQLPFTPNWKLPKQLREDLANPDLTWIVYINPPFATAQDAKQKQSKTGVSKTKVEKLMTDQDIGHAKRELFTQFLYRISKELPKKTYLGMFSTLKYVNAPDTIEYRNQYFNYQYEKGFVFHSKCFHGVSGDFPIGFLLWNLAKPRNAKTIHLDIADNEGTTIGIKHLQLIEKTDVLNNWFERPKNSADHFMPALSNAITVKETNTDTRDRSRPDFLASLCSNGNDFQHAKYVVLLSSPNASAGAFTVTPDIFEQSLVLHAVKKIPKPTWLNDRNQFLKPTVKLPQEFINDCVIWSLFAPSNHTASLSNISYKKKKFDITNHFFPFTVETIKKWKVMDSDIRQQLASAQNSYVSNWISNAKLSKESLDLLLVAQKYYEVFYLNLNKVVLSKWKISKWDSGWFQIRNCLTEHHIGIDELKTVAEKHAILGKKILPLIEEYGFLDQDEVYN